jgi:putative glutamine amidotransferase
MDHKADYRPRVGVPWRSVKDEVKGRRQFYDLYLNGVREAGGEPVELSLSLAPEELAQRAASLDAFVLPGSPADVNPQLYNSARHEKTADPDPQREAMDAALLDHALAAAKPVLAICYGTQLLNVFLKGTLRQDIPSELGAEIDHDREEYGAEAFHTARIEGGHLAEMVGQAGGSAEVSVNSSHHQAILHPGRGLRVTARASDGVIEAVEWTGGSGWVVGVQWHPERMRGDALADALFRRLVSEARTAADGR